MGILLREPSKVFEHGVSPSMIDLWGLCKKRWYNKYIRQIEDVAGVEAYFGNGFDRFWKKYHFPGGIKPDVEKLVEEFKEFFPTSMDCEKRTQELGVKLIKGYVERYPKESEPVKYVWLDQELWVDMPTLKDVKLHIIIDGYGLNGEEAWVVDCKTTSRLGADYFEQYKLSNQVTCYMWGVEQIIKKPLAGLLIDAVGCKKKVDADSFLRQDFYKTKEQLEYGMRQVELKVKEMMDFTYANWKNPEAFTMEMTGTACKAFNKLCGFHEACEFNDKESALEGIKHRRKEFSNEGLSL